MPWAKDFTARLAEGAAHLVQSEEMKRVLRWSRDTSERVRANFKEAKRRFREQLQMEPEDDLDGLKRTLDRLEQADRAKESSPPNSRSNETS